MATLESVRFSQQGEALRPGSLRQGKDLSGMVKFDAKNPPKKENEKEWVIFKLANTASEGGVYLSGIDDVLNPATGKVERIRLLAGCDSIWQKDQKDFPKEYVEKNIREISFPRKHKIRRIKSIDSTMIEFMRMSNSNVGNVNRINGGRFEYYEYDPSLAEKEQFEKEELELEMAILAKEEKPEQMRKHAAFLGIRMINDLGEPKSDDGIRREYVMYAKRNPHYFKQTRNTKQIEISWLVRKAIAESLIDIGREPGKIFWANGGGMIGVYPQTKNAQDYLVDLAMTNTEEGRNFAEQLKQISV